jgi:hypothetical protein
LRWVNSLIASRESGFKRFEDSAAVGHAVSESVRTVVGRLVFAHWFSARSPAAVVNGERPEGVGGWDPAYGRVSCGSVCRFEAEADLESDLDVADRAINNVTADLGYLEPLQVSQCLRRASDRAADGVVNAV